MNNFLARRADRAVGNLDFFRAKEVFMDSVHLGPVDYTILLVYLVAVLGIGFALKRFMKSSSDFLTSGRSIPAWVTGLAFISANLGALELVGMAAAALNMVSQHVTFTG